MFRTCIDYSYYRIVILRDKRFFKHSDGKNFVFRIKGNRHTVKFWKVIREL